MEYTIRVKQVASEPLAVVRRRASLPELSNVVPAACGEVWKSIRAQQISGAGRLVALYLDDQINLEVGVELSAPYSGNGQLLASATPAGRVATAMHLGPYTLLHKAHEAIRSWCGDKGYRLAGPNWEIYGHWIEEWNTDPTKITTEVCYLLGGDGNRNNTLPTR